MPVPMMATRERFMRDGQRFITGRAISHEPCRGSLWGTGRGSFLAAPFLVDLHGHRLEFPDDAAPGEELQTVVAHVDLPPIETLARRVHVAVMVVVPAFPQREEGEEPTV